VAVVARKDLFRVVAACAAAVALSAASAQAADRPMSITGSTFVAPYVQAVLDRLVSNRLIAPAKTAFGGTGAGVAKFCENPGAGEPDVVAMSRRMRGSELEFCKENGVNEIIEIQLGLSALVLVARRDDFDYDLTLDELYHAIAAEIPHDGEFVSNKAMTWRAADKKVVEKRLPDIPINVLVPFAGLGSRGFFEDRFLEAACRKIPDIKTIFSGEERRKQCIGLRNDGKIGTINIPYDTNLREAMLKAPRGTIAVAPLNMAEAMPDVVKVLPLDGVMPTHATIGDRSYPFVRPLYVYVDRSAVKNYKGEGPVAGLREFITELTREQTIGPGGYLANEGLIPLTASRRVAVRESALHLHILDR
jgi:phosphate transport system substrate-binding protein